eukprot:1477790-Amphidinium_carterae.2
MDAQGHYKILMALSGADAQVHAEHTELEGVVVQRGSRSSVCLAKLLATSLFTKFRHEGEECAISCVESRLSNGKGAIQAFVCDFYCIFDFCWMAQISTPIRVGMALLTSPLFMHNAQDWCFRAQTLFITQANLCFGVGLKAALRSTIGSCLNLGDNEQQTYLGQDS